MLLIFYFIFANAQISYLTYDSGYYTGFSSYSYNSTSDFICKDGFSKTDTLSFNGQFNNIPQVFLGLELLDFDKGMDYRLQITTITQTNFQVEISCITSIEVLAVQFTWYAIDDQRIQVINNFNMVNPDVKIFDHINPNANATSAILSITSLGIYGDIDFQVQISSITTTAVTVSITKVIGKIQNLKQLGYQIILGTQEAFLNTKINQLPTQFNSGNLTQQSNRWLFLSFTGFNMSSVSLKEKVIRTSMPLTYSVNTFDAAFVQCNHLISWLAYNFITVYKAFECSSVKLSQSNDDQASVKPPIQIYIQELSLSLVSSEYKLVDKLTNQLNLKVYVKCEITKKIVSQFLRCSDCVANRYHKFTNYCSTSIDAVTYFLKYQTTQSVYKELFINTITNQITITQVLYNQVKITETILDIQIQ